jgi:hypothetical protein
LAKISSAQNDNSDLIYDNNHIHHNNTDTIVNFGFNLKLTCICPNKKIDKKYCHIDQQDANSEELPLKSKLPDCRHFFLF